ncbi:MAG: polysaccharide deacetylase family protein [Sulfitobacter sp.]
MKFDLTPLEHELGLWRAENMSLPIWWRDDDAINTTPELERLSALAEVIFVPVHLAVIPKYVKRDLVTAVKEHDQLKALVHGWAHHNNAPPDAKKAEFAHPRPELLKEAQAGLTKLRAAFDDTLLEVFVPPWNRIAPDLVIQLAPIGYRALSTFTPRTSPFAAPELIQINTHIDPINWRNGGGLVDVDQQVAHIVKLLEDRRSGVTDNDEPLGILTHHLVHDDAIWTFTETLLKTFLEGGAQSICLGALLGKTAQP